MNINWNYGNSALDHWKNCKDVLDNFSDVRELFYAALELRFCLERLCFEYLVLMIHCNRPLSKRERKYYRPKDILKCLKRELPFLEKHVEFFNAVCEVASVPTQRLMIPPDVDWIQMQYDLIGNHLHSIRGSVDENSLRQLRAITVECHDQIFKFLSGRGNVSGMPETGQAIHDAFVEGKIDSDQMKLRLKLTNIPRRFRNYL